jgi:hypothetical protein
VFKTTHAPSATDGSGTTGALFKIVQDGQFRTRVVGGADQFTDAVRVTGVGAARTIYISHDGTYTGNVVLQRSIGNEDNYTTVTTYSSSTFADVAYSDGLDNQIIFYRIGFTGASWTSGSADVSLRYQGGGTTGIARVTKYVSATQVEMEVVATFAATSASTEWSEGAWSGARYWPKAVELFDGRLWTAAVDLFWGSQSDAAGGYESMATGDLATDGLRRSVSTRGGYHEVQWLVGMGSLFLGTASVVARARSGAIDEPITPTNTSVRNRATIGAADIEPAGIDDDAVFVDRTGHRLYQLKYNEQRQDYAAKSLMRLNAVRSDGQMLALLYDPDENALGWCRIVTDGRIESVCVIPTPDGEDAVYVIVQRTIGATTKRYLERLDTAYDPASVADTNPVDSYVRKESATPFTDVTGLDHLEGRTLVVWADGHRRPDAVVTGGKITLAKPASKVVAGLAYEARWRSAKLAAPSGAGTPQGMWKMPTAILVELLASVPGAVEYGTDFTTMDRLPDRHLSQAWDEGPGLVSGYSEHLTLPGTFGRDPRLCLRATSRGGHAQVSALVVGVSSNDKV